jgi:DNA-binding SARP family transcriptional activator
VADHAPVPRLSIALLGAPRVNVDGRPLSVDTRKAIALLAYLAVSAQPHSRDGLCALLWPDYDQESARASLRRTLSALKKGLGPLGERLLVGRDQVSLPSHVDIALDVERFTRAVRQTEQHGHAPSEVCPACVGPLLEAAEVYRGDFMAGFTVRDCAEFEDWQRYQTESLKGALGRALEQLTTAAAGTGRIEVALAAARRWLALDPLHEPAHRQVMLAYAWADQKAAALRQYRTCVRILDDELGVAPLPETTQLAELIRENRTPPLLSLAQVPAPAPAQPRPGKIRQLTGALDYPLVGRAHEWEVLASAYDRARDGGRLVVLEGEEGIGKTRLAESFLEDVRGQGAAIVVGRCYEGESNLAYGPIADGLLAALAQGNSREQLQSVPDQLLSEAARLVPELANARPALPPPIVDTAGAGTRLVEGLRQVLMAVLAGQTPGVLFLDDLQWADEASLQLVGSIARRLREAPMLLLITWRGDVPAGPGLHQLLASARRADTATVLTLPRLGAADVAELIRARFDDGDVPAELALTLYQTTEGVPIFLTAYLDLFASGAPPGDVVPTNIRDLLRARLEGLSELARQVVTTAAAIGHSFSFETLRDAGGRGEDETVAALDELLARRLVREVDAERGALRFDFTHDQIRQVVYQETSLVRRRLLHRRIAEALFRAGPSRLDTDLGQIAAHYQLAGQDESAAEYFRQAGDHARTLHANAEALAHFQSALALGHLDQATLHEAVGDLLTLTGSYAAAVNSYDLAAARADPSTVGGIERKLGNLYARQGAWDLAESHFQAALGATAEADMGERARILAAWSLIPHRTGEADRARAMARQALDAATAANDAHTLAECHNIMGLLARHEGAFDEAARHLQSSLDLATGAGDLGIRVAASNNLALMYATSGQPERGLVLLDTALGVCRLLGDRHQEAALLTNMADFLRAAGKTDAALGLLKEAVPILAEVGAASGSLQPEIWKLADW